CNLTTKSVKHIVDDFSVSECCKHESKLSFTIC
ncbi:hypothetical protein PFFVO_04606, partial [Plasmodium falciparum Vietnam Oak-Knoll (FVO)]